MQKVNQPMTELRFWGSLGREQREDARSTLKQIIAKNAQELVSTFYTAFLRHQDASSFLTHTVVAERLSHSLRGWLLNLMDADLQDPSEFQRQQIQIGEVHARIKLPVHLVLEGASLLKIEISRRVLDLELDAAAKATALVGLDEIVDYAMRLMSAAYVARTQRNAHSDEAFRLFSLGQDFTIERETQRAALMEWSQNVLFKLVTNPGSSRIDTLGASAFGLWVRHRGGVLFQGSPLLGSLEASIQRIDAELLPAVEEARSANPAAVPEVIGALQTAIEEVRFLLTDIFQAAAEVENGRDPLTRALNRRFLGPVLGRELMLAKRNETPLSIVLIDVDHFKAINDRYGHPGGDVVLRQVAEHILEAVRGSDFVFRYGGEEFLIVLVETSLQVAIVLAERIRQQFSQRELLMPDQVRAQVTISAGVASYDGHPDYEYLIRKADDALYQAKEAGRNKVSAADA